MKVQCERRHVNCLNGSVQQFNSSVFITRAISTGDLLEKLHITTLVEPAVQESLDLHITTSHRLHNRALFLRWVLGASLVHRWFTAGKGLPQSQLKAMHSHHAVFMELGLKMIHALRR
ncbi:hypothetical protein AAP_01819 [Ascosphaera apis ARSEF 7405]|uniref:Uncharacterized protein n=1 Tax=Ascosphaera apis ARSEF 7405 TaxID=392613 RepID=A0A168AYF2_9EURO|nr:hypothetical protein AAP_01819 [Ascosphaera apis ARSEF 7405]